MRTHQFSCAICSDRFFFQPPYLHIRARTVMRIFSSIFPTLDFMGQWYACISYRGWYVRQRNALSFRIFSKRICMAEISGRFHSALAVMQLTNVSMTLSNMPAIKDIWIICKKKKYIKKKLCSILYSLFIFAVKMYARQIPLYI